MIVALIMSTFLGVSYIRAPDKPLVPNHYYVGTQGTDPDYKTMFAKYQGGNLSSAQESNKSPQRLLPSEKSLILTTNNQYRWFWALTSDDATALQNQKSAITEKSFPTFITRFADGTYWFTVPKGTKLVSPGTSYLVPESENPQGLYPSNTYTLGTHIQFITKTADYAYRITYGSMLEWWCNMVKEKADKNVNDDANKPVYGYTVGFTDQDQFLSGAVVGVAGTSGVTDSDRASGKTYVSVKIEKSLITNNDISNTWSPITIQEFYYGK